MLTAVLFPALICAFIVWWERMRTREAHAHALPPSYPGQLPIIGHLHLLISDTSKLWQLFKSASLDSLRQGGVISGKLGRIFYLITDPEDALTVANTCLEKHYIYSFARNWLGNGLITSPASIHQRHRKLLNPLFTMPVIHSFLDVFNKEARVLANNFDNHVDKGSCDTLPILKDTVIRTISLTTFGIRNLRDNTFLIKYTNCIDEILHIIIQRFQKVWQCNEFIYNLFVKKQEVRIMKTLNELTDQVIKKYKKTSTHGPLVDSSFKPLVHTILQSTDEGTLTYLETREELNTIILAGYETTTNLLVYAVALIGSFPEIQEKIYEEVMQVLGSDKDVDKYDLHKMVYLEAVIMECLRLLPSVPIVGRYIDQDVKLKNFTLRANSDCFISIYGMNRHSSWGLDVEQFKPERWLDPASVPKHAYALASFSFGKRSCIGKAYALATMKITVVYLIRKYRWTADHTKIQFKLDMTMKPISGHEIKLQRRI